MTIREVRRNEAAPVTDLYLAMCRVLAEADSDWGVPDWDPIHRWILRTTESDDAVCLVSEVDDVIIGFLLASVARHPAMPGVLGTIEEVHVRAGREEGKRKRELVERGIRWARNRGGSPIQTSVGSSAAEGVSLGTFANVRAGQRDYPVGGAIRLTERTTRSFSIRVRRSDPTRWNPTAYVWPRSVQTSTKWRANALPSFVSSGTATSRTAQPRTRSERIMRTRAPWYHPGPSTARAKDPIARGAAWMTRCWSFVCIEPTTHPRQCG
jgi:hypothetical protein